MSIQSQNTQESYNDYKKRLSEVIFERSEGKIPKDACNDLARMGINRKEYDDSRDVQRSIEDRADDLILAYSQ